MRSLDLRGSSSCFCQDSSPASWLITWWYPRLLIGSFCQQMMPRRMATRRKSRQPDTARLKITSEKKKKKKGISGRTITQTCVYLQKYSPVSLPFEGTWHSLSRSSEIESFVILTNSSRGQSRAQPGNCRGYGSTLLSFRYNIDTEAELDRHKDRRERC